ncbi:unnamed protein product [Thelazia callipaeda]|uniref:ATP synthase subunit e, mitochondrial n=1 Tax=Thelazia callipaeda TaxID=103827 RepID=A0A0N5CNV5_THECL|nr:unnamed protein product [Thelazia callipaeda]
MVWSAFVQRVTITAALIGMLGGIGAHKLKQSSDSLRLRAVYRRKQEMDDFIHCKEESIKRASPP